MSYAFVFTVAGLFGLIVGSTLNLFVTRLPQMAARRVSQSTDSEERFNLWIPRSHCPECKQTLLLRDLIPVLSWIILRGQCRWCQKLIPRRYPITEIVCCTLAVVIVGLEGLTLLAALIAVAAFMFLGQAIIDHEHGVLLDILSYLLIWLGLIACIMFGYTNSLPTPTDGIIGALAGYLAFWLFNYSFRLGAKKDGIGVGDFKLFAAIGAWIGWRILPLVLIIAIGLAFIYIAVQALRKQYTHAAGIPFGPALSSAAVISILFREEILLWFYG